MSDWFWLIQSALLFFNLFINIVLNSYLYADFFIYLFIVLLSNVIAFMY